MRNPYETPRRRPERIDPTWERRNDPNFYKAFVDDVEDTRRGY